MLVSWSSHEHVEYVEGPVSHDLFVGTPKLVSFLKTSASKSNKFPAEGRVAWNAGSKSRSIQAEGSGKHVLKASFLPYARPSS